MARKRKVDLVAILAERASMRPEDVEEFIATLNLHLMAGGTPLLYPLRRTGADYGRALVEGMAHEMEHTNEMATAAVIAAHHLDERADYYDVLEEAGL